MSTILPLLYSMFGLAGTGAREIPYDTPPQFDPKAASPGLNRPAALFFVLFVTVAHVLQY